MKKYFVLVVCFLLSCATMLTVLPTLYGKTNLSVSAENEVEDTVEDFLAFEREVIALNSTNETPRYDSSEIDIESCFDITSEGVLTNYTGNYENLVIPETYTLGGEEITITGVENELFYCDQYLTSITFPETITKISNKCFDSCSNLNYVYAPGVTEVSSRSFSYTSITLLCQIIPSPSDVEGAYFPKLKEIGLSAFQGCKELESVNASLITELGSSCFSGCTALKSVDLSNLEVVGSYAFDSTELAGNFHITDKIKTISTNPFRNTLIESFTVSSNNSNFYSDGLGLYSSDTLISIAKDWDGADLEYKVKGTYDIGRTRCTLKKINSYAYNNDLKKLTIPNSIEGRTSSSPCFVGNIGTLEIGTCSGGTFFNKAKTSIDTLIISESGLGKQSFDGFNINNIVFQLSVVTFNEEDNYFWDFLVFQELTENSLNISNENLNSLSFDILDENVYLIDIYTRFMYYMIFDPIEDTDRGVHNFLNDIVNVSKMTAIVNNIYSRFPLFFEFPSNLSENSNKSFENGWYIYSRNEINNPQYALFLNYNGDTITANNNNLELLDSELGSSGFRFGTYSVQSGTNVEFKLELDNRYYLDYVELDCSKISTSEDGFILNNVTDHHYLFINLSRVSASYTANYWQESLTSSGSGVEENNGKYYKKYTTRNFEGYVGDLTNPTITTYKGFTALSFTNQEILQDGSTIVNIYYNRNEYTLTLQKGNGIKSVSGGGIYKFGQEITINAILDENYTFEKWESSDSNLMTDITTLSKKINIPAGNLILTASANMNIYSITASSNEYGIVSAGKSGPYNEGEDVTFTFTPDEGYTLAKVIIDGNELTGNDLTNAKNTNSYTFTNLSDNHTIEVEFEKKKIVIVFEFDNNCTVKINNEIITGGYNYEYDPGTDCQLDFSVQFESVYYIDSITIDGYKINRPLYVQQVSFNFKDVLEGNIVEAKDQYVIKVSLVERQNYTVKHWQESLDNTGTYIEDKDKYYTKVEEETKTGMTGSQTEAEAKTYEGFTAQDIDQSIIEAEGTEVNVYYDRNSYTLTLVGDEGIESVSGNGTYKYGEKVTINATLKDLYVFDCWSGSNMSYYDEECEVEISSQNITLYAKTLKCYTIEIIPSLNGLVEIDLGESNIVGSDGDKGIVVGGGLLILIITPNANYELKKITINDSDVTYDVVDNELRISPINEDITIVAEFEGLDTNYTVKHWQECLVQEEQEGAECKDGVWYKVYESETKTGMTGSETEAEANTYEGFTALDINQSIIEAEGTVVNVYYSRNEYQLILNNADGEHISSVSGNGTYKFGQEVTINATWDTSETALWGFKEWSIDSGSISGFDNTQASLTFNMPASNVTLTATAERVRFEIICEVKDGIGGSISPNGTGIFDKGSDVVVSFTSEPGYKVKELRKGNVVVSLSHDQDYITLVGINEDLTITVEYEKIKYKITVEIDNAKGEFTSDPSISSDSVFYYDDYIKFTFWAKEGYKIQNITDNDGNLSFDFESLGEHVYELKIIEDHEIVVYFDDMRQVTIETNNPDAMALPDWNSKEVISGSDLSLTFTANTGYTITKIEDNESEVFNGKQDTYTYQLTNITNKHIINVYFEKIKYKITITQPSPSASGEIVANGINPDEVEHGSSAKFKIINTDNNMWELESILIDGTAISLDGYDTKAEEVEYEFNNVTEHHSISATFKRINYKINASVTGEGGTITPSGDIYVSAGSSKEFYFKANTGYSISKVFVNDSEVIEYENDLEGIYNFINVNEDSSIRVEFQSIKYQITVNIDGGNGAYDCEELEASAYVSAGSTITIKFTANDTYVIKSIKDNEADINGCENLKEYEYTLNNINHNHIIYVKFEKQKFTIEIIQPEDGGSIASHPNNPNVIEYGASGIKYNIKNKDIRLWELESILVDEEAISGEELALVKTNGYYEFNNVISNHKISATFKRIGYKINASISGQGTISPSDEQIIVPNGEKEYKFKGNDGHKVTKVIINNIPLGSEAINALLNTEDGYYYYKFEDVSSDQTIYVEFVLVTYKIEVIFKNNFGRVDGIRDYGNIEVKHNETRTVYFYPDPGYQILYVKIDDIENNDCIESKCIEFKNIQENHKIEIEFVRKKYTIKLINNGNGSLTQDKALENIYYGEQRTIHFSPDEGYEVGEVYVNGTLIEVIDNQLLLKEIHDNMVIEVNFRVKTEKEEGISLTNIVIVAGVILVTTIITLFGISAYKSSKRRELDVSGAGHYNNVGNTNSAQTTTNVQSNTIQTPQTPQVDPFIQKAIEFAKKNEENFVLFCIRYNLDYKNNFDKSATTYYQAYLRSKGSNSYHNDNY